MAGNDMLRKSFMLIFIVILGVSAKVSWSANDDEAYILKLRYPRSYEAKIDQFGPDNRYVKYKVDLLFPSKDVVRFYDDKLEALGWIPFTEPNYPESDRTWDQIIDGTIKGAPIAHRLLAEWVNKDHSRIVVLSLRYLSVYSNEKEKTYLYATKTPPNNIIQEVTLSVRPFSILPPPGSGKSD